MSEISFILGKKYIFSLIFFEVNGSVVFTIYETKRGILTYAKAKRNKALVYFSDNYSE